MIQRRALWTLAVCATWIPSAVHAQTVWDTGKFSWTASPPLVSVAANHLPASPDNPWLAVKDPSIVHHDGRWHLFCTLRKTRGGNGKPVGYIRIGYLSFSDWDDARTADWQLLDLSPGYHGAPQIFYFAPRKKWYLVYQLEDATRGIRFGPCYSTTSNISDPSSWSRPEPFYEEKPKNLKGWLDFWVICDDDRAHLFFSSLNGRYWRAETAKDQFPRGFGSPEVAIRGDIFEAGHTYKIQGRQRYVTLIEAQNKTGTRGRRYYKAFTASALDGDWQPLAARLDNPFASAANATIPDNWSDSISHGELIRAGSDERLEIAPNDVRFLFQGVKDQQWKSGYGGLNWKLGILTLDEASSPAAPD